MSRFLQTVTKSQSVHACAGGELHICHTYAIHISYMFHTYFILEYHNVWYTLTYFFSIVPYSTIFLPVQSKTLKSQPQSLLVYHLAGPCPSLPWVIRQSGRLIVAWRRRLRLWESGTRHRAMPCLPQKKWKPRTQMSMAWNSIDVRLDD